MAERVLGSVAGRNEQGVMLNVAGGSSLPFTEEQLLARGIRIVGEPGNERAVITDESSFEQNKAEVMPEFTEAPPAAQPQQVAEQATPEPAPTPQPVAEQPAPAPVDQQMAEAVPQEPAPQEPLALSPDEVPPADLPSIPGISQAQAAPGGSMADMVGAGIMGLIDQAIDYSRNQTEAGAQAALDPDSVIGGEAGRPLLQPQKTPPDYYTKFYFSEAPPTIEGETSQEATLRVHEHFKNAIGYVQPILDQDPGTGQYKFRRDADGNIMTKNIVGPDGTPQDFNIMSFEGTELDQRTEEFIKGGGYALVVEEAGPDGEPVRKLKFVGDLLDQEIARRSAELSGAFGVLSTPFYRVVTEEGGLGRVREVMEANGVALADQLYQLRRLENAPIFAGKDMARVSYTLENVYSGLLQFGGLGIEVALDTGIFMTSWLMTLMDEFPETADAILNGNNDELFQRVGDRIREGRQRAKGNPGIAALIDIGWDATQKYAEDAGISYESARAQLTANRGFFETINWFAVETMGFSGPWLARRAIAGKEAAQKMDDFILETYGTEADRKLYTLATQGRVYEAGQDAVPLRVDVIDGVLKRWQARNPNKDLMADIEASFRQSKHFDSLSKYQKSTVAQHWQRAGGVEQRTRLFPKLKAAEKAAKEAKATMNDLRAQGDLQGSNKARAAMLGHMQEAATVRATLTLPPRLQNLTKGEVPALIAGASGYSFAYEVSESTETQDLATLFAVAGAFYPNVRNVVRDSGYGVQALLYTVPGISTLMDKMNLTPLPATVRTAVQELEQAGDPQLAALVIDNVARVADRIIAAENINERAGRTIINSKAYIQGLAAISGIQTLQGMVEQVSSTVKLGEAMTYDKKVGYIQNSLSDTIALRDQLSEAIISLKQDISGLSADDLLSANQLQKDINLMEEYLVRTNDRIVKNIQAQKELFLDFEDALTDVLISSNGGKYLGTEIERLALEAQEGTGEIDFVAYLDTLLDTDKLKSAGYTQAEIERLERTASPLRLLIGEMDDGIERVNRVFEKAIAKTAEFNRRQDNAVARKGVGFVVFQRKKNQRIYGRDAFNQLDADFSGHRLSVTTPITIQTDSGEVIEMKSLLDQLDGGDFYLTDTNEAVNRLVGGTSVDPTKRALYGLFNESAEATLTHIQRTMPSSEDILQAWVTQQNEILEAAKKPLINLSNATSFQKWEYMEQALEEVVGITDFRSGIGRLGIRPKDYRIIISHLGARGTAKDGFAQYSHWELRKRMLNASGNFEGNFFDVNNGAVAELSEDFKLRYASVRDNYSKFNIDPFINDPFIRRTVQEIEEKGSLTMGPKFFDDLEKQFLLDTKNPNVSGFQDFWGRILGHQDENGNFIIDLTKKEGRYLQALLHNRAMSKLAGTVLGERALKIRDGIATQLAAKAGLGTAAEFVLADAGTILPSKLPQLAKAYQTDLPWEFFTAIENLKGTTVLPDGTRVEVPLISLDAVLKPILPESMEGNPQIGNVYGEVRQANQARKKAVVEAKKLVRDEVKLLDDAFTAQGEFMVAKTDLFREFGRNKTPEEARSAVMNIVAAGPGGAERLNQFKATWIKSRRDEFRRRNPGASTAQVTEANQAIQQGWNDLLRNLAIDYVFDVASRAGAKVTYSAADGSMQTANPSLLDGGAIFELLGLETRGRGLSDRGRNFQDFFEQIGATEVLDDLRFAADSLFETDAFGNVRLQNMPTPINLSHVSTRVVAGLRGQVSPRWLIIEHLLRQRAISAGNLFLTVMTDPEVGEALIELATNNKLTVREIEKKWPVFMRLVKHTARTEAFEQNITNPLRDTYTEVMDPIQGP